MEKSCQALDWIDLMEDPRFVTNAKRVDHREELVNIISERLITMESKDIFETMDNAGVPCGQYTRLIKFSITLKFLQGK